MAILIVILKNLRKYLHFSLPNTLFSSPEHNVLMVSFCDRLLSVKRRAASTFAFF